MAVSSARPTICVPSPSSTVPFAPENLTPRSVGRATVAIVAAVGGSDAGGSSRVSASRNSIDPAGGTNGITDDGPAGRDAIESGSRGAGGAGGGGGGAPGFRLNRGGGGGGGGGGRGG